MKFEELLQIIRDEPVFSSNLLRSGPVDEAALRVQLSRWVRNGSLLQLRRGVYCLAPAWQRLAPHPFVISNAMKQGSYISLQSALEWHGLIPEAVSVVTAVTTGRPEMVRNATGNYQYRSLTQQMFHGYQQHEVSPGQSAFIARPEKALLDLIHLTPGGDSPDFIQELRLQNIGQLDDKRMEDLFTAEGKPRLNRALNRLKSVLEKLDEGETL